MRPRTRRAIALLACLLALPLAAPRAEACGLFYYQRALSPERRPSLAREKVLLIHDAARGRQHFVREVSFRRADQRLGFVVPTPTRPEVAAVQRTPFTKLRDRLPFAAVGHGSIGVGNAYGSGAGGGGSSGGVEVLATEKVGSFTAFVLAASDAEGLAKWLRDNELSGTDATTRWLEHYVAMGFYYVALRYDPPADAKASDKTIAAETIRISFDTPLPYYPYFEPEVDTPQSGPRLLEVWTITSARVIPVARTDDAGWRRPLKPGKEYTRRPTIEAALDDELEGLLPAGDLVVQTFQDQKRSRRGFGDILFASAAPKTFSAEEAAALGPLLGILDPGLVGGGR
ncbi:MAG: DUF2330 domain-containing protein [Myxococcales bacterium]|nr:DUF2330 domain-containing protein [Myxococcales bacterium]MCB9700959.1 DUF2330 domain-containing protein [Myxococcales bacterium]